MRVEAMKALAVPTAADWKAALAGAGHTPPEAAALIWVDRTTMFRYTTGDRKSSRADWELYLLKTDQMHLARFAPP